VHEGEVIADPGKDVLKIVAIERFGLNGNIGRGFIKGSGLQHGAIAGSLAHDLGCILAVGHSDQDILFSVKRLAEIGGGFVVSSGDKVLAEMPLEIGGLVTERSLDEVEADAQKLETALQTLGHEIRLPQGLHRNLGFITLPPTVDSPLRITDAGYLHLPGEEEEDGQEESFAMAHVSLLVSEES
jgi:adenine deaminase